MEQEALECAEVAISPPVITTTETGESDKNQSNDIHSQKPWLFKPGQSGNPSGKPAGTLSNKTKFLNGGLTEEDLANLEHLSKRELLELIKSINGAIWAIALKTKEEIADAFKLKLATGGLLEDDMFKALPLMKEWFDREMGKAAQSIAMTVESKGLTKLSDDRLLRLERELSRMTGMDAIDVTPEPKKLDVDV